jgi:hypothetical protein
LLHVYQCMCFYVLPMYSYVFASLPRWVVLWRHDIDAAQLTVYQSHHKVEHSGKRLLTLRIAYLTAKKTTVSVAMLPENGFMQNTQNMHFFSYTIFVHFMRLVHIYNNILKKAQYFKIDKCLFSGLYWSCMQYIKLIAI